MSLFVKKGSTDVTVYYKLVDSTTGQPKTGLTIANIDMQYTRNQSAPAAKVDCTALAATNTAHTDNRGIEIDASFSPGLYRIDWPDAAFATGVDKVILCVTCSGTDPAFIEVDLLDNLPGELATATVNAVADQVWDEAIAGHAAAGSTGLALNTASLLSPPTAPDIADAVWEEALGDHSGTVGSTAEALNAAGLAGDPWATPIPGAYLPGEAGFIVGNNVNATISSRATQSDMAAVKVKTDQLTFSFTNAVDSNIVAVNETVVQGTGGVGDEWRPV